VKINLVVLSITLGAEVLSAISVVVSIASPHRRIWPPSQKHARTGYLMWLFFIISSIGVIAVGIIDWGGFDLLPWIRWGVGVPLWIGGCAFAQWAIIVMGIATTLGDESGLIGHGPYRFCRNPQYVGFIRWTHW
jgi:protein-S-isoprenylcysteine O-methyltransferase Ste14